MLSWDSGALYFLRSGTRTASTSWSQIGGSIPYDYSHPVAEASSPATNLLRIRGPGRKSYKATLRMYYIKVTGDVASARTKRHQRSNQLYAAHQATTPCRLLCASQGLPRRHVPNSSPHLLSLPHVVVKEGLVISSCFGDILHRIVQSGR
ncbi:hypothetical protein CY34DRAFT_805646 [Suillus luteus UH-Slu-Lm8-n1]|uniref:Uncharacterized protein n=1 Tax=Suillus luteus UH-Slu-Lm8-n1 TaxID=930992 RepID=A0A0D0AV86_9AGAM|nr:hypothetical protein CY34DRAFT_805646 [Suillus luteus UH-Slu-Lm8-n1]